MQIDIKNLAKDQFVFLILPILAILIAIGVSVFGATTVVKSIADQNQKNNQIKEAQAKLEEVKRSFEEKNTEASDPNIKKIVEYSEENFGVQASFAPLFDDMMDIAKETGLKIRNMGYNFSPENDEIFKAQISGNNICEVDLSVIGTYVNIQRFLKTLAAQDYLVNFAKVEIVSWQRDKSILISNIKLRFYTKTKA